MHLSADATAWVTGLRRVEAPTRANAPLISWDKAFGLVKINPLAAWTDEEMQAYIDANPDLIAALERHHSRAERIGRTGRGHHGVRKGTHASFVGVAPNCLEVFGEKHTKG